MCQSCLTCIKPNRCLFSLHIRVLASITETFYGFVSRIRAQVFLTLFQMNWPYVRITNVWSEQSTIQRWFHVFYSFSADKLIGPSSAFKAHFQKKKRKSFTSLWLTGSGCIVWLHYLGHLLTGHNCARPRCNVYSCSHASLAFHLCISVEYENALTLWAPPLPHTRADAGTRKDSKKCPHSNTNIYSPPLCFFWSASVKWKIWLFGRL